MIFDYIETFDNPRRRHSALVYQSPLDFEKKCSPRTETTNLNNLPKIQTALLKKDHGDDASERRMRLMEVTFAGTLSWLRAALGRTGFHEVAENDRDVLSVALGSCDAHHEALCEALV